MEQIERHKALITLLKARKPDGGGDYFDEDAMLFKLKHPRKPLVRDIARKNKVNRQGIHSRMIAQLIETPGKSHQENIAAIVENRKRMAGGEMGNGKMAKEEDLGKISKAAQKEEKEGKERDENGLKFFKLTKEVEFPNILWKRVGNDEVELCKSLYNARVETFKQMQTIDLTAHPEQADEMIELDKLNKAAHDELISYNGTEKFIYIHPLTLLFKQRKQIFSELTNLYKKDRGEFTHRYGVCEQNISRIKSNLKHEGLDIKKIERLKTNLARAEMRKEIMDHIMQVGA